MQAYSFSPDFAIGFATNPTAAGHTWSLASVLGQLLAEAERRYGPRDRGFTILGVEYSPRGPQTWYPGNRGDVVVQLGTETCMDTSRAVFQLAHEIIHLLAPTTPPARTVEEGLAVVFSDEVGQLQPMPYRTVKANYVFAGLLVREMLSIDPDAVRKIRFHAPRFDSWNAKLIVDIVPAIPLTLAEKLCEPFPY